MIKDPIVALKKMLELNLIRAELECQADPTLILFKFAHRFHKKI